ncbi:MAG: hypothetical protein CMN05_05835 [Roseibacillus sp.]|nr:hypothetical protein [Roseibacillus sp.]MBP35470.1 hypothetical protein [Roseibacillus sp.]
MTEDPPKSHSDSEGQPGSLPPPDVAKSVRPPSPAVSGSGPDAPLKVSVDPDSSADDPDLPVAAHVNRQVPGADATLGNRLLAALIDGIVAAGLAWAVQLLNILPFIEIGSQLSWVVAAGYLISRDSLSFLQGQSVGKRAMKLQAVTTEGVSLEGNWRPGLIRNAILVIPLCSLVELIVLFTRQDSPKPLLRLGDEWANTKVINAGLDVPKAEKEQADQN